MTEPNARRLSLAAQQLVTAGRPERDLCSVVLADTWSEQAPRCPERATSYVGYDNYSTGMLGEGVFTPAESTTRLCAKHELQTRRMPGWRWSRPLTTGGTIRYPLTEEGVTKALADLDKGGSEDVAIRLQEMGIKGQVGHECACPVHAYLMRVLPGLESVTVGGETAYVYGWSQDDLGFMVDLGPLHVTLPDSVSAFIEDFDQGMYPELIEEESTDVG